MLQVQPEFFRKKPSWCFHTHAHTFTVELYTTYIIHYYIFLLESKQVIVHVHNIYYIYGQKLCYNLYKLEYFIYINSDSLMIQIGFTNDTKGVCITYMIDSLNMNIRT